MRRHTTHHVVEIGESRSQIRATRVRPGASPVSPRPRGGRPEKSPRRKERSRSFRPSRDGSPRGGRSWPAVVDDARGTSLRRTCPPRRKTARARPGARPWRRRAQIHRAERQNVRDRLGKRAQAPRGAGRVFAGKSSAARRRGRPPASMATKRTIVSLRPSPGCRSASSLLSRLAHWHSRVALPIERRIMGAMDRLLRAAESCIYRTDSPRISESRMFLANSAWKNWSRPPPI